MRYPTPRYLKAALVLADISGKDLARLYGCTETFVSYVLTGRASAPPRFRAMVSQLLNVPEERLFPAVDLDEVAR